MSREDLPRWADTPAEIAGLLVLVTGLALTALAVSARIWRDQEVSLWALSGLALAGALIYVGQQIRRLRAGRDGLDVDLEGDD